MAGGRGPRQRPALTVSSAGMRLPIPPAETQAMGDKRSKSTAGSKPTDRQRAARDDVPAELRAQIAVLAEQVRRLNVTDAPRPPSPAASTVTAPAAGAPRWRRPR